MPNNETDLRSLFVTTDGHVYIGSPGQKLVELDFVSKCNVHLGVDTCPMLEMQCDVPSYKVKFDGKRLFIDIFEIPYVLEFNLQLDRTIVQCILSVDRIMSHAELEEVCHADSH